MNHLKDTRQHELNVTGIYFLLSAIASVPIWVAIDYFLTTLQAHGDESVATAATAFFVAGVFVGRFFAGLLSARMKNIPYGILITLSILIVISTAWIFYHADAPLEGHEALNLLLYWIPFLIVSLALGMLIKLIRTLTKNQLQEAQSAAAHSQSELHLLQSQLSPHFLFNTLNNLYGLSITQHEKIPPLLLKLSDLLRYSVYDSSEMFVPFKDELAYIDNYIEFEKIRIGDRLVLTMEIEQIENPAIKIAPMLLIVFIENAFKHSKNTADEKIYIDISLKTWNNLILFSIKNSHNKGAEESTMIRKSSGFGLPNVNKRLQLLYPKDHELTVENTEMSYSAILRLKMK